MPKPNKIRRAFDFLVEHAQNNQLFSLADLSDASGWTLDYTHTNYGKRLSELVRQEDGQFRARPEVLRVQYEEFADLFGQKRRLFTDYEPKGTPNVLVYEFFMPLTHEARLRQALDNLFYRDPLEQRIREIGLKGIRQGLYLPDILPDAEVREYVTKFIEKTIFGYSLSLVSGRFRKGPLATRNKVASRKLSDEPYLVDETTAVVRFILPVEADEIPLQRSFLEPAPSLMDAEGRAKQIRWLFLSFFAEAVTRVVNKEDEIWLLETGMANARLYRWVRREE
ncbi:MAG TPA: hypothetical protein VJ183_16065 [Chloroflexia bacterium]|nr:hypothetical protein [Chloroflexia bacterium]